VINRLHYGLNGLGFESRLGARDLSLLRNFQTDAGAHRASYSKGTQALSVGNRPEREVNHLPQSSAEVKKVWSHAFSLPIRLHGVDMEKLQ
jgi:hypothetical protein